MYVINKKCFKVVEKDIEVEIDQIINFFFSSK